MKETLGTTRFTAKVSGKERMASSGEFGTEDSCLRFSTDTVLQFSLQSHLESHFSAVDYANLRLKQLGHAVLSL